ncbi:MAG: hypothetical protein JSS81_28610 [Acidobacteria bacterium]|nr:hypothetical protein [Acidobacteriota bacterium]
MALIRKRTLIKLCCAAALLDLDESTIRQQKCGTENLTLIRRGSGKRQRVSAILEEVIELRSEWIEAEMKKRRVTDTKGKLQLVK